MGRPEDKYVKLPAIIHLTRLGYTYVSIKNMAAGKDWDKDTNIFYGAFAEALSDINNEPFDRQKAESLINELKIRLDTDDLGRSFFNALQNGIDGIKLIDFENLDKNKFQVVTELPYAHDDDSFRPDIITLINGMPLGFIEVKRQNNKDGILAERKRMTERFSNEIYRRFVNITQLMVFTNNQEYNDEERLPIQGSFYATSAYGEPAFSRFREQRADELNAELQDIDGEQACFILKDNNLSSYFSTPEYISAIKPNTPANRILTSLFSKDRLFFLLKYGFCYVERTNDEGVKILQKHVMRYPQLFATLAVQDQLSKGTSKGIIWHTQGSGKTELAYFLQRYLRDYYQKRDRIAKFYFIVDRIDLATQAADEFRARGLSVEKISSKEDFNDSIREPGDKSNTGSSIVVVNIHKFSEESIAQAPYYNLNIQRVYFMDEAHRSYKRGGKFLADLIASDRSAIKIALTGTPLIDKKAGDNTKDVFGGYLHTYYYNQSIADGYTLRLLREEIETKFKTKMREVLEQLEALKSEVDTKEVYEHSSFVEPLSDYIAQDFMQSKIALGDDSIGALVVARSNPQAKKICECLSQLDQDLSVELVLHNVGSKKTRDDIQRSFKRGAIDILVVHEMLRTGFDAPRLKKLYLCKKVKAHNLLQTLTRVNRPYRNCTYGYIVDFVDITEEFDKTNQDYFNELQGELGDATKEYSSLFEDPEEIATDLRSVKETLFSYDTENVVTFIGQVDAITSKEELYKLRTALTRYRELRNVARMYGYGELLERFDVNKVRELLNQVELRIQNLNFKDALEHDELSTGNLNVFLANVEFKFKRIGKSELKIADEFQGKLRSTCEAFDRNLDKKDPEYVKLMDELRKKFKSANIEEFTADEMTTYIHALDEFRKKIDDINARNENLRMKYSGDEKFLRVHKTMLRTPPPLTKTQSELFSVLANVKSKVDEVIMNNENMLDNHVFFEKEVLKIIKQTCENLQLTPTASQIQAIGKLVTEEYANERKMAS